MGIRFLYSLNSQLLLSYLFTFLPFHFFTFKSRPVVFILHVTELDFLAGDDDLLEVTHLVLPLLLEVDAVAVGELDRLHLLVGLGLEELDLAVLRQAALCHPSQQVGGAVVQGLHADRDLAASGDAGHLALYVRCLIELVSHHQYFSLFVTVDCHRYWSLCHNLFPFYSLIVKLNFLFSFETNSRNDS